MHREKRLSEIRKAFYMGGGVLQTSEVLAQGFHRRDLYLLRDQGELEQLSRGLFQLKSENEAVYPDYVPISKRIPHGVVCLVSALAFHEITTQIPHFVYLAIPSNANRSRLKHPPIRFFWYSDEMLAVGVEEIPNDGTTFKIFDVEKTLIDCIRFRNKLGMDIVYEAFRMYWQRKRKNLTKLQGYAKRFRVEKVLNPILEIIVSE